MYRVDAMFKQKHLSTERFRGFLDLYCEHKSCAVGMHLEEVNAELFTTLPSEFNPLLYVSCRQDVDA